MPKKKEILKKLFLICLYLVLFHKTIAINLIESEPFFKVYRNFNSENSKLTLSPLFPTCSCEEANCIIGSILGQQSKYNKTSINLYFKFLFGTLYIILYHFKNLKYIVVYF